MDDFKEAESLFESLKAFSAEFPQFAPNEKTGLWLTGESYGGECLTVVASNHSDGSACGIEQLREGIICLTVLGSQ